MKDETVSLMYPEHEQEINWIINGLLKHGRWVGRARYSPDVLHICAMELEIPVQVRRTKRRATSMMRYTRLDRLETERHKWEKEQ